jgi:hypothetical protein
MATDALPACQAPTTRAWPPQSVTFQCEITSPGDPTLDTADGVLDLEGVPTKAHIKASVLATFSQLWTPQEVVIGDHVSTIALAPGELLTVEIRKTTRTLLEENRETASTVEQASEQTTADKEAINIANTSARSSNWSISGSGSFSMNGFGASAGATQAASISNTTSSTVNEIHETTRKSAVKVTTQTKVQIHGVTETAVETRQTRQLRNPFKDRPISLNLFEINKKFSVTTSQDNLRPMLVIHLDPISFTRDFIAANLAFLDDALLEPELKAALPDILRALQRVEDVQKSEAQLEAALDALEHYLYDNRPGVNPYRYPPLVVILPPPTHTAEDDIIEEHGTDRGRGAFLDAGWDTASTTADGLAASAALSLFFILHSLHIIRQNPVFKNNRRQLMATLAAQLETLWSGLEDGQRKALLSRDHLTELFRRIPGFLFLYKGLIEPVQASADDVVMVSLVRALEGHLASHRHYYTEQYLRFLWEKLGRSFVVRLTNSVLYFVDTNNTPPPDGLDGCRPYKNLYKAQEVQRDGLCVLVPLQMGGPPLSPRFNSRRIRLLQPRC